MICPDLAYSRELLGETAYYFTDQSAYSFCTSVARLILDKDMLKVAKLKKTMHTIDYAWNAFITDSYYGR